MAPYCFCTFILLSLYVSSGYCNQLQTINGTINIQVGTTSACGFAQLFMRQVGATYDKYKNYIKFEFTPWGRTTRNEDGLICQFGDTDCWANRVQRCAISLLRGNQEGQVRYMLCEFSDPFPALREGSLSCSLAVGINIVAMEFCVGTSYGDTLEGPAEERSREAIAVIDRIPFVVFNYNASVYLYNQVVWRGLEKVVCDALLKDPTTDVKSC